MNYCDFQETGQTFKGKKIYKCSYCGITLSLEDPDAKILCFKKQNDFFINMENQDREEGEKLRADHIRKDQLQSYIANDSQNHLVTTKYEDIETSNEEPHSEAPHNLCTTEEVDARLAICKSCQHFKNETCLLCGCTVVREANFNNKLAHKSASCPINKWGPINT